MDLIRGLYNIKPDQRGTVATIGNFDGVHLGHQTVLAQLKSQAQLYGARTTVISFEPLPREHFAGDKAPGRLLNFRDKYSQLGAQGVDQFLCLRFNSELAAMSADAFIEDVLVSGLGIKLLVVGDDFRFGQGRKGDFALLCKAGERYGFKVVDTRTFVCDENDRVSSTRIRSFLQAGKFTAAARLLGCPFTMGGRVIHGAKLGRTIGFPTLNIKANRPVSPLTGVFAVDVEGIGPGVANVGTRPTVDGKGYLIEVHLLGFSGDLYGRHLRVNWLKKLREEQKFENFDALKQQIEQDVSVASTFFAARSARQASEK